MSSDLVPTENKAGGSMVEVATGRAAQEVQAMVLMAKRYPRDETAAKERIRQACKRIGLADVAMYSYSKGGTKIEGPSIRLAEVLAQSWGNIEFGMTELEQREGESDLLSFCWDLETNTRSAKTFTVKHERHKKGGVVTSLTDPRDIYEHAANYGARRLRACIMAIIPGDIQDFAVAQCNKTLEGDKSEPLADRIQKMIGVFADLGVPQEAIERRLQHNASACDARELIGLGKVYRSLVDGMSKREDWFDMETVAAVVDHKDQAKTERKKRETSEPTSESAEPPFNPPTQEEQHKHPFVTEGSQVDPVVEATEGVDEPTAETPPPPESPDNWDSEHEYANIEGKIKAATTITTVNEARELAGDGDNPWLGADQVKALDSLAQQQRLLIRSKRAAKSKAGGI